MLYRLRDELLADLGKLVCEGRRGVRAGRTAFVLLPDGDAWLEALRLLRAEDVQLLQLSHLCSEGGRLPAPAPLLKQISALNGNVALLPAGELLRAGAYPQRGYLFERLARLKRASGTLIVPMLASARGFAQALPEPGRARLLILDAPERPVRACFCAPDLPCAGADYREWLEALELGLPPDDMRVKVPAPLRFAGNGIRVLTSCYALLSARFGGLEFICEPNTLSEGDWRALYLALETMDCTSARDAFERCAELEADGALTPDSPLRMAAWLARLAGLRAGAYTRRILAVRAEYDSLEQAVALELLAEFDARRAAPGGALMPDRMTASEWLDIRAERGAMLRALGVNRLPPEYWALLDRAPERRKLLYSSLCTPDERCFCRRYLLECYNMSSQQLERRIDVRRMYPELIDELRHSSQAAGGSI